MAYQPNPNDRHRAGRSEEEMRRRDNELQADPQLAEGPASGTKVAMYAIAIAVVLGVVFYGLNNNTVDQAGTTPPSETAQQTQPPTLRGLRARPTPSPARPRARRRRTVRRRRLRTPQVRKSIAANSKGRSSDTVGPLARARKIRGPARKDREKVA